jgi:hypothetical protein
LRLDLNQFEKQKRWRRLPGQDNRENNCALFVRARFHAARVKRRPVAIDLRCPLFPKADIKPGMFDVRFSPTAVIRQGHCHVRFVPTADSCTATYEVHGLQ